MSEMQESIKDIPNQLTTLASVLMALTDHVTELGILDEATERVILIHEAHKNSLPQDGEADPMHVAFAEAALVAQVELEKKDGRDPSAVIVALENHL